MRMLFKQPTRVLWIAGLGLGLLAASSVVAIVGSIPPSYASIPDEDAPPARAAMSRGSEDVRAKDPQPQVAMPQSPINSRNRAWCPTCGVVESMRQIEPSSDGGRQELTIRFRDGRTMVLSEATRRSFSLGSRVIVIDGLIASSR